MNQITTSIATEMHPKPHYYFAGGGTGGHIYPALAIAEKLKKIQPECEILFFCSCREIDARILSKTGFEFIPLPAQGFSVNPVKFVHFFASQIKSLEFVKQLLKPVRDSAKIIGVGGFASAPVVRAGMKLKIPYVLLNVDYTPGKANQFLTSKAKTIFTQFPQTAQYIKKGHEKIIASGCPLRSSFENPNSLKAIQELELNRKKKILLITGASSGALSINNAVCKLLPFLNKIENWQIVHLTGMMHYHAVKECYETAEIESAVIDYYDNMADLYAAADLLIGRGGAVSIAEYAASGTPAIIMPYPYHKDQHQFLNADNLVKAEGAVIVEDNVDDPDQTSKRLCEILVKLMSDENRLHSMANAAKKSANLNAAGTIAEYLVNLG